MIADQAEALREMVAEDLARGRTAGAVMDTGREATPRATTIAVTSGKGGVGKTSISVNLSVQLARMGRQVILMDADLGTANADVICNLNTPRNLSHVVAGRCSLSEAVIEAPGGFRLIAGASGLSQMAALSEFERARLMEQMRDLECRADLILIDTGAGIGPNVLGFLLAVDQILVVTTPEPTAITDAYAVIKTTAREARGRRDALDIRLLVNQVRDDREARQVYDRVAGVCKKFLSITPRYAGHVTADPRVSHAVRRRQPFVLEHPTTSASMCLHRLAHRIDRHASTPRDHGLLRRMAAWLVG
ncbi:MAG: MinD/ParA family protein [Phycisphaeraceae bacterium]